MSTILPLLIPILTCLQASPPATQPSTQPDVLAGPSVSERSDQPPSIVKRAFDGSLEDAGTDPDFAAISLLQLTDEQRNRLQAIQAERMSAFDKLVRSNYGLIIELASMQGESDPQKWLDVLGRARAAFEPFIKRGSLREEMKLHLSEDQQDQADLIVSEYWMAKLDEMRKQAGKTTGFQQLVQRSRLEAFGEMIRESIERQVSLQREAFEEIANELILTEEQKNKALAIFGPLAVSEFQDKATPAEREEAFGEFNKILTPQQRRKLMALLVKQWRSNKTAEVDSME